MDELSLMAWAEQNHASKESESQVELGRVGWSSTVEHCRKKKAAEARRISILSRVSSIDMVSDTFSPLGFRRRRNKDDRFWRQRKKSWKQKGTGKKLEAKISERKPQRAKDPPTSAADDDISRNMELCWNSVQTLLSRSPWPPWTPTPSIKKRQGFRLLDFENEYRKFSNDGAARKRSVLFKLLMSWSIARVNL